MIDLYKFDMIFDWKKMQHAQLVYAVWLADCRILQSCPPKLNPASARSRQRDFPQGGGLNLEDLQRIPELHSGTCRTCRTCPQSSPRSSRSMSVLSCSFVLSCPSGLHRAEAIACLVAVEQCAQCAKLCRSFKLLKVELKSSKTSSVLSI